MESYQALGVDGGNDTPPITWGTVKVVDDEAAFRAAFNRFEGDSLNGWSELKQARMGAEAKVTELFPDQTVTAEFEDGLTLDLPFEALVQCEIGEDPMEANLFKGMIDRLEGKEDIDSFDMMALEPNMMGTTLEGNLIRSMLCFLLQSVVPPLLISQMVWSYHLDKSETLGWWYVCPATHGWEKPLNKVTIKFMGTLLILYMYNFVCTQQYKYTAKPTFTLLSEGRIFAFVERPVWMGLGLVSNGLALIWSAVGSVVLTAIADSSIDVVLNSVALFFLLDIDDQLVDKYDYERNAQTFKAELAKPLDKAETSKLVAYTSFQFWLSFVERGVTVSMFLLKWPAAAWMVVCK